MGSTAKPASYTTSTAFFEALWDFGVTHVFVNLGSDHPSILEAIVRGQNERNGEFPRIITCPNEMVAMSMADGFARLTGKIQCVLVHVDVGTQGLGAAVHNASCGRAPVLIFAGLSPVTLDGEYRGSRTEYIHWIQDVPDQKQIVSQYCRYTGEIKFGRNVKQMVGRALQFAASDPAGPVYLFGSREAMEEEIEPYELDMGQWRKVGPAALPENAVLEIAEMLAQAQNPLVVTGYSGRNADSVHAMVKLADTIPGLQVLDTGGSDMCFPADHPASLGVRYGVSEYIPRADVILVIDCDVPWIPTQCRPNARAKIVHIDVDVLKQQMPVFYIAAQMRFKADSCTALTQINNVLAQNSALRSVLADTVHHEHRDTRLAAFEQRLKQRRDDGALPAEEKLASTAISPATLCAQVRDMVPKDTIFAIEAVTLTGFVADQLAPVLPKTYINCGGGGLGWSGGAALGIKLASDYYSSDPPSIHNTNKGRFVCQIVGDGTFLFSVPGSVYWIAQRYNIPVLTVVLNNKGWNAPRRSLLLVHPEGEGSKVDNKALNISFDPTPDFAGIAKAAAGGKCWAGCVKSLQELVTELPKAIRAVQEEGICAVLEAKLGEDLSQGEVEDSVKAASSG